MKVSILLPNIFDHPFTYKYEGTENLLPGDYVLVPFGKSEIIGIVWHKFHNTKKKIKIKKIKKKLNIPKMNLNLLKFISWFASYNLVSLGISLKMFLHKNITEKKYDEFTQRFLKTEQKKFFKLNNLQRKSLNDLKKKENQFHVSVLEGLTGSGKTIVYFERVREIINKDFQALILLPEIALTDQFSMRFKEFFGYDPSVWHSKTSPKNKKIIWRGVIENKIKIVIGARSSLFLPFKKLGLIIVDEEQDGSYKQDEGVSYNARDMAVTRASIENVPIHLVTSVPSIETYYNITKKKYSITKISKRYKREAKLPKIEIINISKTLTKKHTWISEEVLQKIKKFLDKKEQVLFFLNRRGFAPFVLCSKCKNRFECPYCSVNLTYHKKNNILLCHYCGHKKSIFRKCNDNNSCDPIFCGPGVERVFNELRKLFPDKKIEIFSSDNLTNIEKRKKIVDNIENNKIDIIVGTQLISKGFHFSKLNCIVVVDGDFNSHGYDLRTTEKNIQLYHQLIGRAGREKKHSVVFFQTLTPDDEILINLSKKNPQDFLKKELQLRYDKKLPPYFKLISLVVSGVNQNSVNSFSILLKKNLPKHKKIEIMGPVDAPVYKIKNLFRSRLLIRYPEEFFYQKEFGHIIKNIIIPNHIKLMVDVDPINFS